MGTAYTPCSPVVLHAPDTGASSEVRLKRALVLSVVVELHDDTGRGSRVRLPLAQPFRGHATPTLRSFGPRFPVYARSAKVPLDLPCTPWGVGDLPLWTSRRSSRLVDSPRTVLRTLRAHDISTLLPASGLWRNARTWAQHERSIAAHSAVIRPHTVASLSCTYRELALRVALVKLRHRLFGPHGKVEVQMLCSPLFPLLLALHAFFFDCVNYGTFSFWPRYVMIQVRANLLAENFRTVLTPSVPADPMLSVLSDSRYTLMPVNFLFFSSCKWTSDSEVEFQLQHHHFGPHEEAEEQCIR